MDYIEISKIKPAIYNPRHLTEEKFEKLKLSLTDNGFIIPIIVNRKNLTIIAGHQRIKAATACGISSVPCYFVDAVRPEDEVMFNQLHNATDMELGCAAKYTGDKTKGGFYTVDNSDFEIKQPVMTIVKEICRLILKYGNVFECVCDLNKRVIIGSNYVYAAQKLNKPVNLSIHEIKNPSLLLEDYGEFSYDHLAKETWVQSLAQMHRTDVLTGTRKKMNRSHLYEQLVLPYLKLNRDCSSLLDFGCGEGYYVNKLNLPYAVGVEFYNRNGAKLLISKTHRQIDTLVKTLTDVGRFDVVVCDSVLNSVDSVQAEESVTAVCNALLKAGHFCFISGRSIEAKVRALNAKTQSTGYRHVTFLDKNNFTGTYRYGHFYYQKYHSREQINDLLERYGFKIERYLQIGATWKIQAVKVKELALSQAKDAIEFEFNLPLPSGSFNRQKDVYEAYLKALEVEENER